MGRHSKTTIAALQVWTWYYFVRSKCNLDNKALSRRFCGLTDDQINFGEKNVPKIFERIEVKAQIPSKGNHQYRNYDLIKRVETDGQFHGAERIYVSPFWQLLKEHPFTLASTARLIESCLTACAAVRLNSAQHFALTLNFLNKRIKDFKNSGSPITEEILLRYLSVSGVTHLSELRPYSLDVIGLAGALFRESYLAFDLEAAILFKREYDRLISAYASQEWMKPIAEIFVDHATEKLTMDYKFTPEEDRSFDQRGKLILQIDENNLKALDSFTEVTMQWIRESLKSDLNDKKNESEI